MNKVPDDLYDEIMSHLNDGDREAGELNYESALPFYELAESKLPVEKKDSSLALHIYTALGDCFFNLEEYEDAAHAYNQALQCSDGTGNGYVWLGMGQAFFELGQIDKARNALLSAYMLEGEEIFEDEDEKYFELITDLV
jgi:tetratricopeptide (TPR) repeat protein